MDCCLDGYAILIKPQRIKELSGASNRKICEIIRYLWRTVDADQTPNPKPYSDLNWILILRAASFTGWNVREFVVELGEHISFQMIKRLMYLIGRWHSNDSGLVNFADVLLGLWAIEVDQTTRDVCVSPRVVGAKLDVNSAHCQETFHRENAADMVDECVRTLTTIIDSRLPIRLLRNDDFSNETGFVLKAKSSTGEYETFIETIRISLAKWLYLSGDVRRAELFSNGRFARKRLAKDANWTNLPAGILYRFLSEDNQNRWLDISDRIRLERSYTDVERRDIVASMNCVLSLIDPSFPFDPRNIQRLRYLPVVINDFLRNDGSSEVIEEFFVLNHDQFSRSVLEVFAQLEFTRPLTLKTAAIQTPPITQQHPNSAENDQFQRVRSSLRTTLGCPFSCDLLADSQLIRCVYKHCFREDRFIRSQLTNAATRSNNLKIEEDPVIRMAIARNLAQYNEFNRSYELLEAIAQNSGNFERTIRFEMLLIELDAFFADQKIARVPNPRLRLCGFCRGFIQQQQQQQITDPKSTDPQLQQVLLSIMSFLLNLGELEFLRNLVAPSDDPLIEVTRTIAMIADSSDKEAQTRAEFRAKEEFLKPPNDFIEVFTQVFLRLNDCRLMGNFNSLFSDLLNNQANLESSNLSLVRKCVDHYLTLNPTESASLASDCLKTQGLLFLAIERIPSAIRRFISSMIIESNAFYCESTAEKRPYQFFIESKYNVAHGLLTGQLPTEALVIAQFLSEAQQQQEVIESALSLFSDKQVGFHFNERIFRCLFDWKIIECLAGEFDRFGLGRKYRILSRVVTRIAPTARPEAVGSASVGRCRARAFVFCMVELALNFFELCEFVQFD